LPTTFGEGQVTEFVEHQQIGARELVGEPARLAVWAPFVVVGEGARQ
jgi:hypothetical protein